MIYGSYIRHMTRLLDDGAMSGSDDIEIDRQCRTRWENA